VQTKLAALSGNAEACRTYFTTLWTADGAKMTFAQSYALEQVLADEYENGVIDLTDAIESYKAYKLPTSADAPELEGCVAVDETLAQLLQALIDKYSFTGVDHAWTKLCYYYKDLGPSNP
jgi:hypothetical protein